MSFGREASHADYFVRSTRQVGQLCTDRSLDHLFVLFENLGHALCGNFAGLCDDNIDRELLLGAVLQDELGNLDKN